MLHFSKRGENWSYSSSTALLSPFFAPQMASLNIAAAFAKVKAHFMFRNVEVMAQLRDALTDKILIFGYLEQADTPFPIYTIICKYCNINRGRAFSIDVSVFE